MRWAVAFAIDPKQHAGVRHRRVVGILFAATLVAACSGAPGAAPEDARTGGKGGGGAVGGGRAGDGPVAGQAGGAGAAATGVGGTGLGSEDAGAAGADAGSSPAETDADAAAASHDAPPVDGGTAARAAGCGMPAPPLPTPAPPYDYLRFHVMTTGATLVGPAPTKATSRSYWVRVPADYDPNRSYRTVFQTGTCEGPMALPLTLPLYDTVNGGNDEAIYVVIGVPEIAATPSCYDTASGPQSTEFEAFALVHDAVAASYCVDEDRVFVVSRGRSVSDQLGCYFGGGPDPSRPFGRTLHVRGQALVNGEGEPPMQPHCTGPVAAIWFDDTQGSPPQMPSTASLARVRAQDACNGTGGRTWGTNFPCQQAVGCPTGYPVVSCAMIFGRTDQSALTVKMFETFMEQASPAP